MATKSLLGDRAIPAVRRPVDTLLTVEHPHGPLEIPLSDWIEHGPGERDLLRPVAARDRRTGQHVSLREIPLRYRNTKLSRTLVLLRVLPAPWPRKSSS
jgi:hypothetical protein